jgi:hypothetical protein
MCPNEILSNRVFGLSRVVETDSLDRHIRFSSGVSMLGISRTIVKRSSLAEQDPLADWMAGFCPATKVTQQRGHKAFFEPRLESCEATDKTG